MSEYFLAGRKDGGGFNEVSEYMKHVLIITCIHVFCWTKYTHKLWYFLATAVIVLWQEFVSGISKRVSLDRCG